MISRHFTVWSVIFALCVYGWTSVTVQLLGSSHLHSASSDAPIVVGNTLVARVTDTFREIREWRSSLYERLGMTEAAHRHADGTRHTGGQMDQPRQASADTASAAHPSVHLSFQRHHHAIGDPTVVAIDANAGDLDANGGSAASVLGAALMPPGSLALFSSARSKRDARWLHMSNARWSDAMVSPLDRPPRS